MRRGKNTYILGVNNPTSPIVIHEFAPTSVVSVVHSAYGDISEGVLRSGDRAPDAPGLVPIVSPNRASCNISSSSQSIGMAGSIRIFASTDHAVIVFAPTLAVPDVRLVLVVLDQNTRKQLVRRVIMLPGPLSEADGRVEMSSEEDQAIDMDVLVDQAGHAYRGYVIEKQDIKVVVVRPDGVVGANVRGAAGLERYFEGVFRTRGGMCVAEDVV
ncbi:hypothetical protein BKA82DRAFT_997597 [Pisolithus tinctorius]|uniref:Phenol hydroxylase-like C-terminal dimerisation domain-containing protein n=1 Tax=Pisolithus tinctorius Marx 270 TaxID=870435 RepID=A0A0C3P4E6_PISTI|nr:hypothetical protein BKA82DRAFT_997597 [Pisolithus tinctorius]KIO07910.1 hypothetical protein M404DRAFT_997597 [Pisolithus tinctorius Marx 270]